MRKIGSPCEMTLFLLFLQSQFTVKWKTTQFDISDEIFFTFFPWLIKYLLKITVIFLQDFYRLGFWIRGKNDCILISVKKVMNFLSSFLYNLWLHLYRESFYWHEFLTEGTFQETVQPKRKLIEEIKNVEAQFSQKRVENFHFMSVNHQPIVNI